MEILNEPTALLQNTSQNSGKLSDSQDKSHLSLASMNISTVVQSNNEVVIISDDGLVFRSDGNCSMLQSLSQLNSYYIKKADMCCIEENESFSVLLLTGDGKLLRLIKEDRREGNTHRQIIIHNEVIALENKPKMDYVHFKLEPIEHFFFHEGKSISDVVIKDVKFGKKHGIIMSDDGKCFSFGFNYFGCLGHDYYTKVIDVFNTEDSQSGTISYSARPYFIQTLSKVTVKQISVGDYHTLCVTDDGRVFSFGRNNYGQLGTGDLIDRYYASPVTKLMKIKVEKSACGSHFSLVLSEDGTVFGFGSSQYICQPAGTECTSPMLIHGFGDAPIEAIHCGRLFSIAVTKNKDIFIWGEYQQGRLLLEPISLTGLLPSDQTLCNISCCKQFLFIQCKFVETAVHLIFQHVTHYPRKKSC